MISPLTQKIIPAYTGNYTAGRQGTKIQEIALHHVAGVVSVETLGNIWATPGRNGSSHYGIGYEGTTANYVDEDDIAWTNSNWESNKRAVTIETSNISTGGNWLISDASLNSLIKLVADISKRNGLHPLVKGKSLTWHSMYAATACPGGDLFSKIDYIIEQANLINDPAPTPAPTPAKSVDEIAQEVVKGYWGNQPERQQRLEEAGYNYEEVRAKVNEIVYGKPEPTPSVDLLDLTRKTIRGDFGNGQARKDALGAYYDAVQAQVQANINAGTTQWDNIRLY